MFLKDSSLQTVVRCACTKMLGLFIMNTEVAVFPSIRIGYGPAVTNNSHVDLASFRLVDFFH